jgi:hypothetical protein
VQWSERDPGQAVRERIGGLRGRLERQARLAGSARARERDEPDILSLEELDDLANLAFASEERRRGDGQPRAVEALQRRELLATELPESLRRQEVLQAMFSQLAEVAGADERLRRIRADDLSAVRDGRDARGAVDVHADVSLVGEVGSAGVHAHAHADRSGGERGLRRSRCLQGGRRRVEGEEKGVALRVHFHATTLRAGVTDPLTVLVQGRRVALGTELVE